MLFTTDDVVWCVTSTIWDRHAGGQGIMVHVKWDKPTDDPQVGWTGDQRLSMCRFIPLGQLVSRVAIHLFSLIFLRTASSLQILSITISWDII